MKHLKRYFLTTVVCLAVTFCTLLSIFIQQVHASSTDPTVVIANASLINLSGCTITTLSQSGAPVSQESCPPVVQVQSSQVPLSQAEADNESYILLPPPNSPPSVMQQTMQEIIALMHAAGNALLSQQVQLHYREPLSSCSTQEKVAGVPWNPFGNTISNNIYYTPSSDCTTIFLDSDYLTGQKSVSPIYWDHDQYASWSMGTGCPYIGTTQHHINPDVSQKAGYYYEPWISDNSAGPACYPLDNFEYIDISLPVS